jgi:hypothetical protein
VKSGPKKYNKEQPKKIQQRTTKKKGAVISSEKK